MCENVDEERDGDPAPPSLDEDGIEDVRFAGEIARREDGVLAVGLADGVVGGVTCVGREDREGCAEDEKYGEDG